MIKLNPDKKHVLEIRKALAENNNHCPCSLIIDDDHLCPCLEFRKTMKCHCELYINID
jgi:ferredoxin-thioredoxin reductase catalytic subunit